MARPAKPIEEAMRSSTRLYGTASMKSSIKLQEAPKEDDWGYKIKLAIFFVVSIFLIFNAMTPARKAPYRKGGKK